MQNPIIMLCFGGEQLLYSEDFTRDWLQGWFSAFGWNLNSDQNTCLAKLIKPSIKPKQREKVSAKHNLYDVV